MMKRRLRTIAAGTALTAMLTVSPAAWASQPAAPYAASIGAVQPVQVKLSYPAAVIDLPLG
ncbi:hypothetical protein [Paenibacillus sp. R14(2021)]|uniref:hypothetical protein n=1 Tax=Paenibacillus sp. R14(2021) TaxID=2859228 RepID=UPI001C61251B|nr:hypothetical protein [Paenibacillus sp. R14(2021)]